MSDQPRRRRDRQSGRKRRDSSQSRSGARSTPGTRGTGRGRTNRRSTGGSGSKQAGGEVSQKRGSGKEHRRRSEPDPKGRKLPAGAEGLPRNVVEALLRVTPPKRQNAALTALAAAGEAFSEGQYYVAVKKAEHAKELSPRDATIREILGLGSYRVGDWQTALRELRTYRRLSGETTHMPVEMDVLRALARDDDVESVWNEFRRLGGGPAVKKEARVVYGSYLIDKGDLAEAAAVVGTPRKSDTPWPEDLRLWYVAARIAALAGRKEEAGAIAEDILLQDPSFPGLDDLDRIIEAG